MTQRGRGRRVRQVFLREVQAPICLSAGAAGGVEVNLPAMTFSTVCTGDFFISAGPLRGFDAGDHVRVTVELLARTRKG